MSLDDPWLKKVRNFDGCAGADYSKLSGKHPSQGLRLAQQQYRHPEQPATVLSLALTAD